MQGIHGINRRPGIVTLLAVLQFIGAFLLMLVALFSVGAGLFSNTIEAGTLLLAGVLWGSVVALQLVCGIGLWKLKGYGRTILLVFSWIGLVGFPIGTVISILILAYLSKPGIKILFTGKQASQFTAEEAAQVAAVMQGSVGVVLAVVVTVLVGIVLLGIIAAIAVPGLLRARMSANEASAIVSLRTISSAQARYSQKCNGYAPSLPDLKNAGDFLSPDLARAATVTKSGYNIAVEPSANASLVPNPPGGCAGTVTDYFAHADPVTTGGTGTRYFATDARGTIFQSTVGIANPIEASATPVQ